MQTRQAGKGLEGGGGPARDTIKSYILVGRGANGGGGAGSARLLPAFHTMALAIALNRGALHLTLGLRQCIILSFLL